MRFVENKKQFQLNELITEQRHLKTWDLSFRIKENSLMGIEALLSVDQDISNKFVEMAEDVEVLEQAAKAIEDASPLPAKLAHCDNSDCLH